MVETVLRRMRLFFAAAALAAGSLQAAGPAAIVTDLRGDVRAGSGERVDLLSELPVDAQIVLSSGAHLAVVHLATQSTFNLAGPGAFAIRARGVEGRAGARVPAPKALSASFQGVRLQPARIAQASIAMRGAAADDRLRLLSPVATWVLEAQPMFIWRSHADAGNYALQLTDSENRVLFETVTSATTATLPAHVALEPGRLYGWQVQAPLSNGQRLEAWAEFGIADAALRSRIDAARPLPDATISDRILFALLLESLNVHAAARDLWAQIAREHPHETRLRTLVER